MQLIIRNPTELKTALARIFREYVNNLKGEGSYEVIFRVFDYKTRDQEKKYHAMLGDIAEQAKHLNQTLDEDSWKRLCVQQFRQDCIDNDIPRLAEYWRKTHFKLIPSLDGKSLVQLGAQTKTFPKYVAAGFIEWLYHYGAENRIVWSDPKYQDEYERMVA